MFSPAMALLCQPPLPGGGGGMGGGGVHSGRQ